MQERAHEVIECGRLERDTERTCEMVVRELKGNGRRKVQ